MVLVGRRLGCGNVILMLVVDRLVFRLYSETCKRSKVFRVVYVSATPAIGVSCLLCHGAFSF